MRSEGMFRPLVVEYQSPLKRASARRALKDCRRPIPWTHTSHHNNRPDPTRLRHQDMIDLRRLRPILSRWCGCGCFASPCSVSPLLASCFLSLGSQHATNGSAVRIRWSLFSRPVELALFSTSSLASPSSDIFVFFSPFFSHAMR